MPLFHPTDPTRYLTGTGQVAINKVPIFPPDFPQTSASGQHWYTPDEALTTAYATEKPPQGIFAGKSITLLAVHVVTTAFRELGRWHGVKGYCGGGGRWAVYAYDFDGGPGYMQVDGVKYPQYVPVDMNAAGYLAYKITNQEGLFLCPPGVVPDPATQQIEPAHVKCQDVWFPRTGGVSYHVLGDVRQNWLAGWPAEPQTTVKAFGQLRAFLWTDEWWLLYQEFEHPSRVVCHPAHDASVGYVIAPAGTACNRPDAEEQAGGALLISYSNRQDVEAPGDIQEKRIALDAPLEDLKVIALPPPVPQRIPKPLSAPRPDDGRHYDVASFIVGQPETFPRKGPGHPLHQVVVEGDFVYFLKFGDIDGARDGSRYELWPIDRNWVYHLEDASGHHTYWWTDQRWLPRMMRIGEAHHFYTGGHREHHVQRGTFEPVLQRGIARKMWLVAVYDQYDWGVDLGVRQTIVVAYDPTNGHHAPNRHMELYYFALGAGWVRWESYPSDLVYANGAAAFPANARAMRSDFYLTGGPAPQPSPTGAVPIVMPAYPPLAGMPPVPDPTDPEPEDTIMQLPADVWATFLAVATKYPHYTLGAGGEHIGADETRRAAQKKAIATIRARHGTRYISKSEHNTEWAAQSADALAFVPGSGPIKEGEKAQMYIWDLVNGVTFEPQNPGESEPLRLAYPLVPETKDWLSGTVPPPPPLPPGDDDDLPAPPSGLIDSAVMALIVVALEPSHARIAAMQKTIDILQVKVAALGQGTPGTPGTGRVPKVIALISDAGAGEPQHGKYFTVEKDGRVIARGDGPGSWERQRVVVLEWEDATP